jgi:opacity protein-like surface antigen
MKKKPTQMKKIIIGIFLIAGLTSLATAQHIRLNGYAAYVFDDKIDSYYDQNNQYYGQINGGFQWGAGLEYLVSPSKGIELKYLRRDAVAPMHYYKNSLIQQNKNFDIALNYVLVGGNNYFQTGGKVEPYAGASLGMCIITLKNVEAGNDNQATKFAWGVKLGTNIWATEKVGIKLQVDLISAVQSAGGSLYFGTGGTGAGIGMYSTMYQWVLGGGLTIKMGK